MTSLEIEVLLEHTANDSSVKQWIDVNFINV